MTRLPGLAPRRAAQVYGLTLLLAAGVLAGQVFAGWLPVVALISLLALAPALKAAAELRRYAEQPARLAPAIRATIAAAHLLAVLLAAALIVDRLL